MCIPGQGSLAGHRHPALRLLCAVPDQTRGLVGGPEADRDPTAYTVDDLTARALSTRQSEGVQIRSMQLAIERLRVRPGLASILVHKPGPLFDESPARQVAVAEVYRRGLEEVGRLLAGVRTRPG